MTTQRLKRSDSGFQSEADILQVLKVEDGSIQLEIGERCIFRSISEIHSFFYLLTGDECNIRAPFLPLTQKTLHYQFFFETLILQFGLPRIAKFFQPRQGDYTIPTSLGTSSLLICDLLSHNGSREEQIRVKVIKEVNAISWSENIFKLTIPRLERHCGQAFGCKESRLYFKNNRGKLTALVDAYDLHLLISSRDKICLYTGDIMDHRNTSSQ